ncbi:unnamed protein product [Echinostoma caproni]|uniref:POU domain protein n=1 Tax=Echinostoma caproni TaxID=27848 RepID=A0A183AC20_9TREM|nr:unnamed protein product [Echinostoma caproni]
MTVSLTAKSTHASGPKSWSERLSCVAIGQTVGSAPVLDAATQTEETSENFDPSHQWTGEPVSKKIGNTFQNGEEHLLENLHESTFIPNRAMYSQETLQLSSQQEVYYNQVQSELAVTPEVPQCYYTDNATAVTTDSDAGKCGAITSKEVRRVISEWVEKYEQWFFQNFGVDVKIATASSQGSSSGLPSSDMFSSILQQQQPNPTVTSGSQSESVVSGAPISYVVSEGAMCMPENHMFSPYVSLLPSFYTPAAFNHNVALQHEQTVNPVPICNPALVFPQNQGALIGPTQQLFIQAQQSVPTQWLSHVTTPQPTGSSVLSSSVSPGTVDTSQLTAGPVTSFSDLPTELQTSAMLAALSLPVHTNRQQSMGQWGPLLRYGTYGRLPSASEIQQLKLHGLKNTTTSPESNKTTDSVEPSSTSEALVTNKMPPPPPTFILLRRQVMICALQLSCRERGRELFLREKEGTSGMKVDFVNELEQVVEKSINLKPIFLFTELRNLPKNERSYFLEDKLESRTGQNPHREYLDPARMYACDLLIGDVLIAEACSTYKQQAKNCVARQFGRGWMSRVVAGYPSIAPREMLPYDQASQIASAEEALLTAFFPAADLVPKLPPFLSDPFESLSKKDRTIDPKKPNEPFDVVNPKLPEDFWLYLADLPITALEDETYSERILSQSAEFSQMTIAFDVEVNTVTGWFLCTAIIDNHRYSPLTGSTVSEAEKRAVKELLETLRQTQPVVGAVHMRSGSRWQPERLEPLWGVSERALVDTLMWGKEERDLAIDIEQLEAHCDVPELPEAAPSDEPDRNFDDPNKDQPEIDRFSSLRHLENFIQAYAASALVTPLRLSSRTVPPRVWPLVRQVARNWGLLSCIEKQHLVDNIILCVLICKRAPLPRLKRTLYEKGSYGCFTLLDKGNLHADALKRLLMIEPLIYDVSDPTAGSSLNPPFNGCNPPYSSLSTDDSDPYSEEPVTRLARHFIATGPKLSSVKNEPKACEEQPTLDDCVLLTAELNQPSSAIEILDDLPKTLIPGIDF